MNASKNEQLKSLLKDTVLLMCKSVAYKQDLRIEALVGVTVDSKEVILVGFNEILSHDNQVGKGCSATESKTYGSKNVQGKDGYDVKQMSCNAIEKHQQGRVRVNRHEKVSLNNEQVILCDESRVSDVIICEEKPLPKQRTRHKLANSGRSQRHDDDLIYVGEETYSLVTGNFVKEEQLADKLADMQRKRKQKAVSPRAKAKRQNIQMMSQVATLPSVSQTTTLQTAGTQQDVAPTDNGQQNVGVRKKRRMCKYVKFAVAGVTDRHIDQPHPTQHRHPHGLTENEYFQTSAPDVSPITGTSVYMAQSQKYDGTQAFSALQPAHIATSTPIRDTSHVSWATPISHGMYVGRQASDNHGPHSSQTMSGRQLENITWSDDFVQSSGSMSVPVTVSSSDCQVTCATVPGNWRTSDMASLAPVSAPVSQTACMTLPTETKESIPLSKSSPLSQTGAVLMSSLENETVPASTSEPVSQTYPVTVLAPVSQTYPVTVSEPVSDTVLDTTSVPVTQTYSVSMSGPVSRTDVNTMSAPVSQSVPVTTSEPVSTSTPGSQTYAVTNSAPASCPSPDNIERDSHSKDDVDRVDVKRQRRRGRKPATSVTCPLCEKELRGTGMLRRHINQKHPDIVS